MSYAGVSITKDLACIAAVADSGANGLLQSVGKPVAVELYTYSDGRAFRGCPHFTHWRNTGQFYIHDKDIEEVDFARALRDFMLGHGCGFVGYSPEQIKLADSAAIPIPKDSPYLATACETLAGHASRASNPGYLFDPNTAMQFMWNSMPGGKWPTAARPAKGRYDGIRALVYAMAAAMIHDEEVATPARLAAAQQQATLEATCERILQHGGAAWVRGNPPFNQLRRISAQDAVANLLRGSCVFCGFDEDQR